MDRTFATCIKCWARDLILSVISLILAIGMWDNENSFKVKVHIGVSISRHGEPVETS